jgi:hypothetical protein
MQFNKKLAIILAAASASVLGFGSIASAGEGGAAAATSFTVTGGQVTGGAAAGAVGKQNAGAYATNNGSSNTAGAIGTAGTLDINGSNINAGVEATNRLGTAQANGLENDVTTPLGTDSIEQ